MGNKKIMQQEWLSKIIKRSMHMRVRDGFFVMASALDERVRVL